MSEIKKGDRVRFTGEGVVRSVCDGDTLDVENGAGEFIGWLLPDVDGVTVEKIEPPVETFRPGDYVRSKGEPGSPIRLLTVDGWVNLETLKHCGDTRIKFTSETYERVNLVEPPL